MVDEEEIEESLEILIRLGLVEYIPGFDRYIASDRAFRLSRKEKDRLIKLAMDQNQKMLDDWLPSPPPPLISDGEGYHEKERRIRENLS